MGKGKHVFQDRRLDDLHRVRISIEAGKRTYIKKVLRPAPEISGEIYRDPRVFGANARISKEKKRLENVFLRTKSTQKKCVYKRQPRVSVRDRDDRANA